MIGAILGRFGRAPTTLMILERRLIGCSLRLLSEYKIWASDKGSKSETIREHNASMTLRRTLLELSSDGRFEEENHPKIKFWRKDGSKCCQQGSFTGSKSRAIREQNSQNAPKTMIYDAARG